jgi:hypothetical protein
MSSNDSDVTGVSGLKIGGGIILLILSLSILFYFLLNRDRIAQEKKAAGFADKPSPTAPTPTPAPQNEFRFVLRPGQSSDPIETRGEYVSTEWTKGIPTTVTVIYDNGDCKRFHVTNRDHVDIPIRDWQYIKQLIYCRSGIPPRDSPYSVANWTNAPVEYRVRLL